MEDVRGATAFITGGAQGIGRGIARAFAGAGMRLALADVDADALAEARAELAEVTDVAVFELDVRDRERYAEVADAAERSVGPVSVLVNNAGVGVGALQSISAELSYATWDYVVGINLDGVNNGIQTFLPRMIERGGPGHVVNTSSAAGLAVFPERSSGYTYHASKFAVTGLSEALRRGLADEGRPIGVSVLIPGMVGTKVGENSVRMLPAGVVSDRELAAMNELAEAGDAALRTYGRDPDEVGAMVLAGVRADLLYLPTDRLAADVVVKRAEALVAAMPAEESRYDSALADAMRERRAAR
ncbi:SDR family NAD(P)-dependent oxidoreductase [Allonocardiopsis opalescens]|uniref:NADP-dependent 3-hydroxy acid dehydrogenase YdfG n=1 Tax=Allonocardiopsis opalescens TaxID=1144618 RepID=A0A2T0Q9B5_9ACTN|nr:SDR family NAD(P)-dependent oxidoreductase [Allonocardiopsis opalescens]PRY00443.1 NADP-dependent 3-hydroxy acid dehydrogenase YdfG [Allonocardiopsis opalescens]